MDFQNDIRATKPGEIQGWRIVNPYEFDTINILEFQKNMFFKHKKALLCLNCGHVSIMDYDNSEHEITNLNDKIEVIYKSEIIEFVRTCNHI